MSTLFVVCNDSGTMPHYVSTTAGRLAPTSYNDVEQQPRRGCVVSMHEYVNPTTSAVNDTVNTGIDGRESWEDMDLSLMPRELLHPPLIESKTTCKYNAPWKLPKWAGADMLKRAMCARRDNVQMPALQSRDGGRVRFADLRILRRRVTPPGPATATFGSSLSHPSQGPCRSRLRARRRHPFMNELQT